MLRRLRRRAISRMQGKWLLCGGMLLASMLISYTAARCNEAVCASLVSKCMLLQACECNMQDKANCTCCKECHKCLAKLYTQCCSCVGMCPSEDLQDSVVRTSTVEELADPIPGLFSVLTEEEDSFQRWTTFTYPAHLDLLYFKPRGHALDIDAMTDPNGGHQIRHGEHRITISPYSTYQNCTVAYMSQCMSLNKCRMSCQSMGAARYRWFHEHGCCECIGSTCLDFGKGEAHCLRCPAQFAEEEDEDDYDSYSLENDSVTEDEEDIDDMADWSAHNAVIKGPEDDTEAEWRDESTYVDTMMESHGIQQP